jgi:tetraacyldisaccharide 4'-kinase
VDIPPALVAAAGSATAWHRSPLLTGLLAPFSWLYGGVVTVRRRWRAGRGARLPCPVVSVGNLTCGGTGKTPAVEMVLRDLLGMGRRPALLSRGYGGYRNSSSAPGSRAEVSGGPGEEGAPVNDESLVVAANLPGVPHYLGADRVAGGRRAVRGGADVVVLDDGFQHLRLERDLDIVLVDALRPFDNGRLLPAGLLREPLGAAVNAHLLGITRTELAAPSALRELMLFLARRFPRLPQLLLETVPMGWEELGGELRAPEALRGQPVVAFAGVGNPEAFRGQLRLLGVVILDWLPFRDHHRYRIRDVERLSRRAREAGAAAVVMTQKDAVKLRAPELRAVALSPPWLSLKIRQTVRAGQDSYRELLARAVAHPHP